MFRRCLGGVRGYEGVLGKLYVVSETAQVELRS